MLLSDFNYTFPHELVAQHPLPGRDTSRMMVVHRSTGEITHRTIRDMPDYVRPGDVLVINTSKVIPARLIGRRETGGRVEVVLLQELSPSPSACPPTLQWRGRGVGGGANSSIYCCLATRTNRLKTGAKLSFAEGLVGEVQERAGDRVAIAFNAGGDLLAILDRIGLPPLPPYIERPNGIEPSDRERYQTVYADQPGSAAAPTAGLHFTPALLNNIRARGVTIAPLTLHVGTDTFAPVRVERIAQHTMHGERYEIPAETISAIVAAKRDGRRVIAVGTTSVRALESAVQLFEVRCSRFKTDIEHRTPNIEHITHLFISPGYQFRVVDALLTNFHQPRSTLLMLVSALAGLDTVRRAYAEAIAQRYRLFSYGDCMLIA